MKVRSLAGKVERPPKTFCFDPVTAKAIQGAERYKIAGETLLLLSALAAILCYIAEVRSFLSFTEWLAEHLWIDSQVLQRILAVSSFIVIAFLALFGIPGIYSLYTRKRFEGARGLFIALSVALILPSLALRDGRYFRIIMLSGLCHLASRWLAAWAEHQRPHDWKIIFTEKRRLNWGPLEFATALTKGKASDGHPLAIVYSDNAASSLFPEEGTPPVKYERLTTLLTLTLKHRYPWSRVAENWQMLCALLAESGCTEAEREQLSRTWLYVHSEVEGRVSALIGESRERGFGHGVWLA